MIGRVAKGLLQGRPRTEDSVELETEALLSRAADGVLPHDQAEALAMLSELMSSNEQAHKIVGLTGLSALQGLVKENQGNKDLLRGALECLKIAVSPPSGRQPSAGSINAELFCRDEENLSLVFSILADEKDFYVRYHAVQLLTALSTTAPKRLTQALLKQPGAVTKLMDLLGDSQDVIRNEALLLMIGLTHSSPEIKRFAAYEGAFENQISIIRYEGGTEGGIVVQDCLDLMNNLLRDSPSNQLLFRESGSLGQLVRFTKMSDSYFGRSQPRQRVANMMCLLDTFIILTIQPRSGAEQDLHQASSERTNNCAALLGLGLMDSLLMLALKGSEDGLRPVRKQALLCIAHLISSFKPGQERLIMSGLGWLKGIPALRQILRICLYSKDSSEHTAARSVIRAFCLQNLEGQSMLTSTLLPAADSNPENTTFGGELCKALSQQDSILRSRAAAVLTCMLDKNPAAKERLLQIPLSLGSNPQDNLLLPLCLSLLSSSLHLPGEQSVCTSAILLKLLNVWIHDCKKAVVEFRKVDGSVDLMIDLVIGRKGGRNGRLSGLGALLLGCCLLTEEAEGANHSDILHTITTTIGLGVFFKSLDQLYADEQFKEAEAGPRAPHSTARSNISSEGTGSRGEEESWQSEKEAQMVSGLVFDHAFAIWAVSMRPLIRQHLIGSDLSPATDGSSPAKPPSSLSTENWKLDEAVAHIQKLERELDLMKARNRALVKEAIDVQRPGIAQGATQSSIMSNGSPSPSSDAFRTQTLALEAAERRLVRTQEEVAKLKTELSGLREQQGAHQESQAESQKRVQEDLAGLQDLRAKLREAERDRDEASAAASKFEADLQALSQAYGDLEMHAHSLESHHKAATSTPADEQVEEDSTVDDLLACLGEEEQKVERLSEKLRSLGIDPQSLIGDIGQQPTEDFA